MTWDDVGNAQGACEDISSARRGAGVQCPGGGVALYWAPARSLLPQAGPKLAGVGGSLQTPCSRCQLSPGPARGSWADKGIQVPFGHTCGSLCKPRCSSCGVQDASELNLSGSWVRIQGGAQQGRWVLPWLGKNGPSHRATSGKYAWGA